MDVHAGASIESAGYQERPKLPYPGVEVLSLEIEQAEAPILPDSGPKPIDLGGAGASRAYAFSGAKELSIYREVAAMGWRNMRLQLQLFPFHSFR